MGSSHQRTLSEVGRLARIIWRGSSRKLLAGGRGVRGGGRERPAPCPLEMECTQLMQTFDGAKPSCYTV